LNGAVKTSRGQVAIVIREVSMRQLSRAWIISASMALVTIGTWVTVRAWENRPERYLYVWAGDQTRTAPDFVAVIDFDSASANYGRVITTRRLPEPGATGNEPRHVGLSSDGRTLAIGGLLSVLKGQHEIFFFDVTKPASPRFISSVDPPQSAITDEFYPIPGGGFLVTKMGGPQGHHPGRVVELDSRLRVVAEHPTHPPDDGFNPHGISVRPELNLMVTSDFICPSTTLGAVPGGLDLRGSVRVWALHQRRILKTINVPGAGGTIDVQLIPGDRRARAYTAGMLDDKLYLIDTRAGDAKPVFDFATIAKGGWPQLIRMTDDGRRLFITMNVAGRVAMFDTSDPAHPALLSVLDLGVGSGPHYLALTRDERRLVVSDYFLNEDTFGKVHQEGDHKVHVANVSRHSLTLDTTFDLDFNAAFPSGAARPHGLAMK
jgi:selenium-binding protein 1